MKKILVLLLAIVANLYSFAQTTIDMRENFSLSGKSITFLKTENANDAKPSAKFWNLQGVKNDSIAVVRFWLKDPVTEEVSDSVEWGNGAYVTMRISDKGNKMYFVQDADSVYLKVINLHDDFYAVQMCSTSTKVSEGTSTLEKEGWQITKEKADELKGNEAYISYMYNQPGMGSFVFWGFDNFQFRIISDDGIFNYESVYSQYSGSSYSGESITVGLYDGDDKLIEKFSMWLDRDKSRGGTFLNTRNAGSMGNPSGQKGKVKKIFKHLQGNSGYVRIVATRYNHADFDIKIPPVKE
ncbi:MAG: hypothetical protein IKN86_10450 [Bacteroidaceae bacterium]|nr:hypothetical protein [Bacteroidaceae bacterium]